MSNSPHGPRALPASASLLLALGALLVGVGPASAEAKLVRLPEKAVAEWAKAGARVGWMKPLPYGFFGLMPERNARPGYLPAFGIDRDKMATVAKLPDPGDGFGLCLDFVALSDADLALLARLESLRVLHLNGTDVTGQGLKHLAGLKDLQEQSLSYGVATGVGMKELASLKKLEVLRLRSAPVSDAGLGEIGTLRHPLFLDLSFGRKITSEGMKALAGHPTLEWLDLDNTHVTDAGVKQLAGLPRLRTLDLTWAKIADAGLKEVARIKTLETLRLNNTRVTDEGVKQLAGLPDLRTLELSHTKVTGEGFPGGGFKKLRTLRVNGARLTAKGREEMKKALPECEIKE